MDEPYDFAGPLTDLANPSAPPAAASLASGVFTLASRPAALSLPLDSLAVRDLLGAAPAPQPLAFQLLSGGRPAATLRAPDEEAKAAWLRHLALALRAHAPPELQLERHWLHKSLLLGTLHSAAALNEAPLLAALCTVEEGRDAPCDVNALDHEGASALMVAAAAGHCAALEAILGAGASLAPSDADGATALHLAIGGGHATAAAALLANGAPLDATDLLGRSPLALALSHPALARGSGSGGGGGGEAGEAMRGLALALLAYGAPPSEPDGEGWAPLHRVALLEQGSGLVKALGKRGGEARALLLVQAEGGADETLTAAHLACGAAVEGDPRAPAQLEAQDLSAGDGSGGGGAAALGAALELPAHVLPLCLPTLGALLAWGAPPNAPTGAARDTPLHLVLKRALALGGAGGEAGGEAGGSARAALRSDYLAAASLLAAAGARLGGEAEVLDARGVSARALARALGVERALDNAREGWAARRAPVATAAMLAAAAAAARAGKGGKGGEGAGGKARAGSAGAGVLGFFARALAAPTPSAAPPAASTPRAGSVAAQGGGGSGGSGSGGSGSGAPLGQCVVCATYPACVLAGAGEVDSDEDGGSSSSSGGGGGASPRLPSTPAPAPALCEACCNRAWSEEESAAAEASAWARERAEAAARARNFSGGSGEGEGGGGGGGSKRGGTLGAATRGLASAAAARAGSEEAARASLFAGAAARAGAAGGGSAGGGSAGGVKKAGFLGSLQALMGGNKEALELRGEKLRRTEDKAADLAKDAAEFGSLAEQLKKRAQAQSAWGFF